MERVREVLLRNRQLHYEFRHYYTGMQVRILLLVNFLVSAYGFISLLWTSQYFVKDAKHAYVEYGLLGIEGIIFIIFLLISYSKRLFKPFARERYIEILTIICCLIYIAWSFLVMIYSIVEGRETNYLPVLMTYAICSLFTYIGLQHYVILYVSCYIGAVISLGIFKGPDFDVTVLLNVCIFGTILLITGITRYRSAQKRFFATRDADNLREELEANNEELIATNDNLITTTDRLRDAMERQRLFTASMNHELRSPLNGILGILQIVRDDDTLSEENRGNIETAIGSSKTLLQIVNDLLDFSKMEAGEFSITKEQFNLRTVVDSIQANIKPQAIAKGLDFSTEISPDTPAIMTGDSVRIGQIITNIASNGVKYTSEGYVKLNIYVTDKNKLVIAVKDSGQGIAPDAIDDLFVPFKRLNEQNNKKIQGTGLGLNIVKNLVEAMNGTIKVESELGKGSVFTVAIPVSDIDAGSTFENAKEEKQEETIHIPELSGKKILCVDDNKVNLAVFRGMFKGTNAIIETAYDGQLALEALEKTKYDIVFLDHMMPEMDGLEVFDEHMKKEGLNKDTPFVMLTGNATKESEKEYLSHGLTAYLAKPIIKEALFDTIEKLI